MNIFSKRPAVPADPARINRRTLVAGAGVAGAAAVAARALQSAGAEAPTQGPRKVAADARRGLPGHAARAALLRDHEGLMKRRTAGRKGN